MGSVALISGASRGIGRGVALGLAAAGFDVAVGYRSNEGAALDTAELINAMGRQCVTLGADVSDSVEAEAVIDECVQRLGRLDVLVANAARLIDAPLLETSPSDYDLQMDINVRGTFFLVQMAARQMVRVGRRGRIVVITSDAAVRSYDNLSVYSMTKAACRMLVESAARELAPHGITVNAVAPGTTETDMNREALADPKQREILLGSLLVGRPGSPEDVARAVVFLTSPESDFITGTTLAVDGGASIH